MKLEFSGSSEIAASRERVWQRLIDPRFVARSAPGVESVEMIDPTHFKVTSGLGVGSMKARLTLDGEMFDLDPGNGATMRMSGRGMGSVLEVLSSINLEDADSGKVRLEWSATTELNGMLASLGPQLVEGIADKLTEHFWVDFARRVTDE